MKKTLLFSALAVVATMTAGAKTADQLRIYINPGHGSWTGNDRPNPIIGHGAYSRYNTDTTNFFESNTNLRKGFGILERLIDYGLKFDRTKNQTGERWQIGAARDLSNNIVMSHVKCGPYHSDNGTKDQLGSSAPSDLSYYNRNLTEVAAEVEANNFDMFISIHSDAADEGTNTNYPTVLYRGYDTPTAETGVTLAHQTTSRKMAETVWPFHIEDAHAVWTSYKTTKNIRGDINFYKSSSTVRGYKGYLGVLKHGTPGFLIEGYFHTYQPARHRAMNWDVCRMEGVGYARGIAEYFGLEKEKFGTIYGIVRDKNEQFTHKYYTPNASSDDIYKPINGCKVYLKKDGNVVAEYTTDDQYNGAYVFDRVTPGNYTIEFNHPDYAATTISVTVKAATTNYPSTKLDSKNPVWVDNHEDYPDPAALIEGRTPASEYTFNEDYTDVTIAELEGKIIRRTIVRNGKLYVLAIDKLPTYAQVVSDDQKPVPTVLVYDLKEKKVLANLSTEGTYGSIQNVADIQLTGDGILLAGNQTKCQYADSNREKLPDGTTEPRGAWTLYRWDNDANGIPTGKPKEWFTSLSSGRWYRAYTGPTFAYSGTSELGTIALAAPSITAPAHTLRTDFITVAKGAKSGEKDVTTPNNVGDQVLGDGYRYTVSPLDANCFVINGKSNSYIGTHSAADAQAFTNTTAGAAKVDGAYNMFKYAGANYLVAADQASGKNVGVRLVNIDGNIDKAVAVTTVNTTLPAVTASSVAAFGEVEFTLAADRTVTDAWINLYTLRDGKISKRTTRPAAPVEYTPNKAIYAYDLKAVSTGEEGASKYQLSYKATGDAKAATLVLTPAEGEPVRVELPTPVKGENTFTLSTGDVPADTYNWAIELTSEGSSAGEIFSDVRTESDRRGGAVVITDPTQPSFGYTVVSHGMALGIDIYDPTGEKVGTRLWKNHATFGGSNSNQSNPFRGHELDGKAVLAAWGDGSEGIIIVDPLQKSEPTGMYAGTKQGNGHHLLNGVNVGGGVAGLCFVGKGDDTKLYTFSEDHEGLNGKGATENSIVRYDLGTSRVIDKAPIVVGYKAEFLNTNVDMLGYGNGFFASQVRGAGNNSKDCPGFAYLTADGDSIVYQSYVIPGMDNCNSGIAITVDGKKFAVGETNRIAIYDVTWKDGKPSMTLADAIPMSKTIGWSHMRFDYAGNLHTYLREDGGYHVYAMSNPKPVVSTPAASDNVITITAPIEYTPNKSVYAYDLKAVRTGQDAKDYLITYKATGDGDAATLVLYPRDGENDGPAAVKARAASDDVVRIELPAPVKGENTYTLSATEVADRSYDWAVELTSTPTSSGEVASDVRTESDRRGGAVVITDPTQPSFGYTVVSHGMALGVDIYDPTGEKVGTRLWKNHATFGGSNSNQSNPFRGHELDGKAVLAAWGDGSEGIIIVDPLQEAEPTGMYAGTKEGNGNHVLNGVNLGGGVAGLCFVGKGEDTKLYTFSEDHESKNGSGATENSIVRYDLGNSRVIDKAPTVVGFKSRLSNTNVDMLGYGNGFFASQVRGGGNNDVDNPGFIYVTSGDDKQVFDSSTIPGMDNCNSGIAITVDGKKFAVGETNRIAIYDVTWNDGKPSMTLADEIPMSKTIGWSHMRFDYAGNLHTYLREDGGYHVYAVKNTNPVVATPAKPENFLAIETGVEDVTVDTDAQTAEPVYYNLNGVRVPAESLTPGVYVKVVGKTATKVIVK